MDKNVSGDESWVKVLNALKTVQQLEFNVGGSQRCAPGSAEGGPVTVRVVNSEGNQARYPAKDIDARCSFRRQRG